MNDLKLSKNNEQRILTFEFTKSWYSHWKKSLVPEEILKGLRKEK